MNFVSVTGKRNPYVYFLTKIKSPCNRVGIIEPDGIRNGSKMNDRMTRTNSNTGKNDREYSTNVSNDIDALGFVPVRQTSLSIATAMPVSKVSMVRINARLMLKIQFSLVRSEDRQKCLLRNFDRSYLFHPALAGLLFFQQFALAGNIAAVTFRGDVLT
jgi:hypothetical protein